MERVARILEAALIAIAFACSLASTGANAQSVPSPKDTPEYRMAIENGLQEFSVGNYPEARAAFARAHALYPNARTLRGMGLSAFEARDYVEAIDLLSAASASAEQPLTEAHRREARDAIDRAKGYVSKVQIDLSPLDATLAVDGQAVQLERGQLLLNPGDYQIQARAEGREPVTLTISAKAGRSTTITISLPPASSDRPVTVARGAVVEQSHSPWPYVVAAAGAAALIAAAITGAMTAGAEGDLRDSCDARTCDEGARDRGKALQATTNVLLPVGAALLIGGATWWLIDELGSETARPDQHGVAVTCLPGACMAEVRAAF